jgi:O-antigen/teichoic acid export membrane protein
MSADELGEVYQRLLTGTVIVGILTVGAQLLGFLENILLTNYLSVKTYGAFSIAITAVMVVSIVAQLGFGAAVKRFVSEYRESARSEAVVGVIVFGLGVPALVAGAVSLLLFISADSVAEVVGGGETAVLLRALAFVVVSKTVLDVYANVYYGENRPGIATAVGTFGQPALRVLAVIVGVSLGLAVEELGYGISVAFGVLTVVVTVHIRSRLIGEGEVWSGAVPGRRMVSFALPLLLSALAGRVLSSSDYLLLGALDSPGAVGIYRPAFLLATTVTLGFRAANQVFYPIATRLHTAENTQGLQRLTGSFVFWTFSLSIPIFLWLVAFGGELLGLFFGPEHARGRVALTIILVAMLSESFFGPVGSLLEIHERTQTVLRTYIVAGGLNVGLNLVLIPRYGIIGAAAATTTSLIALNAQQWWSVRTLTPVKHRLTRVVKVCTIGGLLLLPFVLVPQPTWALPITAVVYFCLFVRFTSRFLDTTAEDQLLITAIQDHFD